MEPAEMKRDIKGKGSKQREGFTQSHSNHNSRQSLTLAQHHTINIFSLMKVDQVNSYEELR